MQDVRLLSFSRAAHCLRRVTPVLGVLALIACGPAVAPNGSLDSGVGFGTGDGGSEMPFDAGPPPVPRPDAGDVGASCTRNSSCTQGPMAQCIPAQAGPSGGYCTASCTTDSDCGPGNSCQTASKDQFGDSNPFCTHTCNTDSDCRSGELCITYEGESFCWYACQTPGDCINSQTDTCDVVTGLCTGETAPGIEPYDAGPPCTPTGCGTKACQDTCGNFDSSCSTTCDSANQGYNSCGGVDPSCGSIPDAGPDAFVTIPLGGCPFLGYDAPVTIDSQSFQLDIDTGSTTTFVAASSCSSCRVTPEYSPPSGTDTGMSTQSQYGSGQVSGEVYLDQVRVGNEMPTVKLYFGGITDQQGFFIQESCSGNGGQQGEGLLGLGPIDLDTIGMNSNDAYFTDLVASAMGIKNVFAVNLCTAGGNLWFGGYDTSFASGPVTYTPLVNNGYWSVNITSIGLGTQTFSNSGDANSVVDTGTGTFLMPTNAYNALVSALSTNSGASTVFGSGALGQSFFNGNNCLQPRGGQSQSEIDAALPNLTVTLPSTAGGSFTLHMPATQSYLALMGGAYCPGVSDSGRTSGSTIWGAPGLRAYITVFDIGNSRIGFAPQSSCQ